jgi:acetamidase/formamidase
MVVSPGTEIEIETLDSSAGQLNAQSTVADLVALDFARVNIFQHPSTFLWCQVLQQSV